MKKGHKVGIGIIVFMISVCVLDYWVYVSDKKWYEQLNKDLPIGTPIDEARAYLSDQRAKHQIEGLREDFRPDMRGFIFDNHNSSLITSVILNGFDLLLVSYVVVRFDEKGRLKKIFQLE